MQLAYFVLPEIEKIVISRRGTPGPEEEALAVGAPPKTQLRQSSLWVTLSENGANF